MARPKNPTNGDTAPTAPPRRRRAQLRHRNLPLLMLVAREGVTAFFRPLFREFGLTEQQWRILRALNEDGEMMIGQIAERCYILGPSLTGILQRMIDADLAVKRVDPDDTRRFYVSVTKRGMSIFEGMVPRIEEEYAVLERTVGTARIAELYELLDAILKDIQYNPAGAPNADT